MPSSESTRRHLDRMRSVDYGRLSKAIFLAHGPPDWLRKLPVRFSDAAHSMRFQSRHTMSAVWPVHDLIFNDILLWILPTHGLTLLIKFSLVTAGLLTATLYAAFRSILMEEHVLWYGGAAVLGFVLAIVWCWYYRRVLSLVFYGKTWMDPTVPGIRRLAMHVPLRLFESEEAARRAACQPQLTARNEDANNTPNVWRMDDLEWKFRLKDTAEEGLEFVEQQEDSSNDDNDDWNKIPIPSNWTLQDFCKDNPVYTNQKYPFPCQPPLVPHQNATGVYRVRFDSPWDDMASMDDFTLLFHGVESAFYVFLNGTFVGFSKDSRLPAEFDVTPYLLQSDNLLQIVVMRWSDGSYVEDQDHWWMAGIHRSVELIRRKSGADVLDYQVQADASGHLTCSVDCRPSATGKIVQMKLYNDIQLTADGTKWKSKSCLLSQECQITSANTHQATLSADVDPSDLELWTAETPNLYTLTIAILSGDRKTVLQVESCRVGFRTVDIHDGAVHINGRPIVVLGMNRHEHDPDTGKVVSMERMMQDICILKYVCNETVCF